MSASWYSLYLRSADAAESARQLAAALAAQGYAAFDPFGLMPGKTYRQAVRAFAAPSSDGWVRVLSENALDERLLAALSAGSTALALSLEGENAHVALYHDGQRAAFPDDAEALLRPGKTTADLRSAYQAITVLPTTSNSTTLPLDALPEDVRRMAGQVDMKQAEGMFARLSGGLLNKAGGGAAALPGGVDWSGPGGQRLQSVVNCVTLPDSWRTPDFVTLRDAYQLHLRRQRLPNARLYPGDAEAMAAVPDALTYTPVYAGRDQ